MTAYRRSGSWPEGRVIRPCMVSFFFHPQYSGSAIQAHRLSRLLQARGVEPVIVSANLTGSSPREVQEGISIHRIPVVSGELQVPSFYASLARFIMHRKGQFDLIHAHGTLQHAIVSLLGRVLRKPTILKVAMADSDIAFHRQGRVWGRINRSLVGWFDCYIATTEAIAAECIAQGLETTRVQLIPNGVDTDVFTPATLEEKEHLRAELGLPSGPLVTYVGIINSRKNIDGILRIWCQTVRDGGGGSLVLVGPSPGGEADPYSRQLQEYVSENHLDTRVRFLGRQADVAPYLRASDVFLFPSRQEGMPNCVLEAMACGLPCLVSRSAGVGTLITHGRNGFMLDVDDEPGFAELLTSLVRSPSCREEIGRAASDKMLASYSLSSIADRYVALYQRLLGVGA
jgi:glycosyltransferase involved in cell wall biosynthesis